MAKTDPKIGINYNWGEGDSGWSGQMDENLFKLGILTFPAAKSVINDPPATPSDGDTYIIGSLPTDTWANYAEHLAIYNEHVLAWIILPPKEGFELRSLDSKLKYLYKGGTWTSFNDTSGGGSGNFTELLDTPVDYTGQAGKIVMVNNEEDGLEFTENKTGLDIAESYLTPANNIIAIKAYNSSGDSIIGISTTFECEVKVNGNIKGFTVDQVSNETIVLLLDSYILKNNDILNVVLSGDVLLGSYIVDSVINVIHEYIPILSKTGVFDASYTSMFGHIWKDIDGIIYTASRPQFTTAEDGLTELWCADSSDGIFDVMERVDYVYSDVSDFNPLNNYIDISNQVDIKGELSPSFNLITFNAEGTSMSGSESDNTISNFVSMTNTNKKDRNLTTNQSETTSSDDNKAVLIDRGWTVNGINTNGINRGFIVNITACSGNASYPQYNSSLVNEPTWDDNFSETINDGLFSYVESSGSADTGVVAEKIINYFDISKTLRLYGKNSTYPNDRATCRLYFLNDVGSIVAALFLYKPNSFRTAIRYGTSSSVPNYATGSTGSVNGDISFTETSFIYTNLGGSNDVNDFSINCDMTSVVSIRVLDARAYSTYTGGGTARVSLEVLP